MRKVLLLISMLLVAVPLLAAGGIDYDRFFTHEALRIDLHHTGTAGMEVFALDELVEEPHWAGNPSTLIDTMNLGGYLFRAYDLETNALIFSRGYCTIFGEWVTTDEALEGVHRTFHETIRMPYPRKPVQVRIDRRDRRNIFKNVYDLVVDPEDYHIRRDTRYRFFRVRRLKENGPPHHKVDLVIIGDGYRQDQAHKLRKDTKRFIKNFFNTEPFKSRTGDFNVTLIETISEDTGVDNPRAGSYKSNLLGLSFNSLDIDRYMITKSNKIIRDIAGNVPYDQIIILANGEKYGGGGIFKLYSTSISDNEFDAYIFVHEFGHAFAGLGDEYYSSEVTYNDMYPRGVEPWEPNITALLDTTSVKWGDLIAPDTPVPTPDDSTYNDVVGCFEGAGYSAKGLYRPYRDCRMFSKSLVDFCPVCRRAIERMIDFYTQ
ncbi:MAG: peptidase M64 [bacterium]|nr:MAG: peptidase M64 [bacterium]